MLAATLLAAMAVSRLLARVDDLAPPDRVILTPIGDPTTSAAVTWRGPASTVSARAQIAHAAPGPDLEKGAKELTATNAAFRAGAAEYASHSVALTGLSPETVYAYRVTNGSAWSEWFQFRTSAPSRKPFRFLYLGDEQNELASRTPRVIRQALADAPDVRLILHGGDLTNAASSDSEWGQWFAMAGCANASILNLPAIGNHQYEKITPTSDERRLTPHWRAQFTLPENGVTGLEESCYFVDYQGVRFVVLNSMEKIIEQASWLDTLLTGNPCRWTVVTFHHPIYSGARNRDNAEIRAAWRPVFDRHKVDLVLTGHDHVYGRSDPSSGPAEGHTVYVTSVSGTKQYDAGDRKWAARFGQDLQLYQLIGINGDRMTYEAKTADGAVYDAFAMQKAGGRARFSDRSGGLGPERLRAPK
jgi:3',5'-cyclic AMP phosphodiesterase CpdA